VGKLILTAGVVLAAIGAVVLLGEKIPGFRLGRLPGDIVITKGGNTVFIPITSMLLVSLLITLGFSAMRIFKR